MTDYDSQFTTDNNPHTLSTQKVLKIVQGLASYHYEKASEFSCELGSKTLANQELAVASELEHLFRILHAPTLFSQYAAFYEKEVLDNE